MLKLLFQNAKARLSGNKAKANAHLGLVSAPEGSGKLVWLVTDDSYDNAVKAAALLAAIREKRKDIRLVLTYQTEYRDVLARHFNSLSGNGLSEQSLGKIGFGYGVGDSKFAARQIIKRLSPFAVIFVGHQPPKTLIEALSEQASKMTAEQPSIHKIAFQFTPDENSGASFYEACYPDPLFPSDSTFSSSTSPSAIPYVSPPFSVLTRLVQSQIDKQLGAMLRGEAIDSLFHIHQLAKKNIMDTLAQWKKSPHSQTALLALSFNDIDNINVIQDAVEKAGYTPVLLSQWRQNSLSVNDIVIADEKKWYAALCAASVATHLIEPTEVAFWQAVSSGTALTYEKKSPTTTHIAPAFADVIKTTEALQDVYDYWSTLIEIPMRQRKTSDDIRKIFWRERRLAETQVDELLQRVYDW